MGRMAMIIGSE